MGSLCEKSLPARICLDLRDSHDFGGNDVSTGNGLTIATNHQHNSGSGELQDAGMTDDDALMLRVQSGDQQAFAELLNQHQGALQGFFTRHTRDRQLAEDLTQETLLRVYNQSWDYLPRGAFRGWMFRIARNLLIDTTRRRAHDALVRAVKPQSPDDDTLSRVVSVVTSPADAADRAEMVELVDRLLQQIPEEQRLTFLLHHYSQLTLPEVADAMETSLPTCKSRLRLAKEKLRHLLLEHGVGDPLEPVQEES